MRRGRRQGWTGARGLVPWLALALAWGCASSTTPLPSVPSPDSLPPAVSSGPPGSPRSSAEPLPEAAAPSVWVGNAERLADSDVIDYRVLSRADFQGTQPPAWAGPFDDNVRAITCALLMATPDTNVSIEQKSESEFEARLSQLRFVSQMDRNCSWWNPKSGGVPDDYILQHEQIHFAIHEIEARRLESRVEELQDRIRGEGSSADAAYADAQGQLNAVLSKHVDAVYQRSYRFDQETSNGIDPEAQARWWEQISQELAR